MCLLLALVIISVLSQSVNLVVSEGECAYLLGISVILHSPESEVTVKGSNFRDSCITNIFNKDWISISIECSATKIPVLKQGFINNMEELRQISVPRCSVKTIRPKAFLNIPKLIQLDLSGNELTHISANMFNLSSLEVLSLLGNKIISVDDYTFENLPHLKQLILADNQINFIKKNWFSGTNNIFNIDLRNNSIYEIPPDMFQGWKEVGIFDLSFNKIAIVHVGAFSDITPRFDLYLKGNQLASLHPEVFSESTSIGFLSVSYNLLNYLSEDLLKRIKIIEIIIKGNPFKCPCLFNFETTLSKKYGIRIKTGSLKKDECYNMEHIPICWTSSRSSDACTEYVENDGERLFTEYLRKLGYEDMHGFAEYCERKRYA